MAVGEGVAVGDPADRPRGALAGLYVGDTGERFLVEEALAGEERRYELASGEHEVEVLRHAALVLPALLVLALEVENHRQARQEIRLGAHQVLELAERDGRRVEILRVGPQAHDGSAALFLDALGLELVLELAAFERDEMFFVVSEDRNFAA